MELPRLTDAEHINLGVANAVSNEDFIDDATARRIASQLHSGQWSALYRLASSGAIDAEGVCEELTPSVMGESDPEVKTWASELGRYAVLNSRGPIEGWHRLTDDTPEWHERVREDRPQIWVGCLAAYNNGQLHGRWIPADRDAEEVWEDVNFVLITSPIPHAEEIYIADYENFAGYRVGEYDSIERVTTIAQLVAEYGEAFGAWLNYAGIDHDLDDLAERFTDSYWGSFESHDAFVAHVEDEFGVDDMIDSVSRFVPDSLRIYIKFDSEALVHDMNCNGDIYINECNDGRVHVFRS